MKRIFFLIGVGLLALAFLTTAAEMAARSIHVADGETSTALLSLGEVWRTTAPGSFLALMDSAQWPIIKRFLVVPGWLLFGAPGLTLVIVCHKRGPEQLDDDHENALFLFDELAAAAQKEGYSGPADDMASSGPDDIIPAEAHFANDLREEELGAKRDFLLKPNPEQNKS